MFSPILATGATATGTTVSPTTGHLVLTGKIATVSQTGNQIITTTTGHILLSGKVATITRTANQSISPTTGHLVLNGYVPVISQVMNLTLTVQQAQRLMAVIHRHGIVAPLVITPTSISAGAFVQSRAWNGTIETDTTTGLPSGSPTAAQIDKLARYYGIIDPVQVTATGRTDGVMTQTFTQVVDDIMVTTL